MLAVQFQESTGKQTSSYLPRMSCFTSTYRPTYFLLNSILNLILLVKSTRHKKSRSKHLTSIKTTHICVTGCWMVRLKWRSRNSRKRVSQSENAWWLHCWDDESARTSSTPEDVRVNKSMYPKSRVSIISLRNWPGSGPEVAWWLRCCATSRTVPGSIPGGVTGFFSDIFPSDRSMALGSNQPLVKMSTRNIPGSKGGQCVRLKTSPPSRAESRANLGA